MACSKTEAQPGGGNAAADLKQTADTAKGAVKEAASALKAFQQTVQQNGKAVPDVEVIVKAAQSMSGAALAQITQQNGSPSGDFSYDLSADGKGIVIRAYTKRPVDAVVIVPEKIEDIPVTEIADQEYHSSFEGVAAVVLPGTITRIGAKAFAVGNNYKAQKLVSINFPSALKSIGRSAFFGTGLTSVILPEGLETLEIEAADGGGSTGGNQFRSCGNIVSLTLPGSLKTIPDAAFEYLDSLTELVIPEGVKTIGADAFQYCESLLKVTFPSTIKEIRVTRGGGAFGHCSELAEIIIPDSVTSIKWTRWSFDNTPMGDWGEQFPLEDFSAFRGCGKLKLAVRQRLKDLGYKGPF
jgi:hypothetical protein